MAYAIGTVDNTGPTGYAHRELLAVIKTLAEANGWTTLRYDTSVPANHELIMKGVGLSGTEEIFIGFRCYESVSADYYNIDMGTFTGYVAGNTFHAQPGAWVNAVPGHNNAITYFIECNAQRITGSLKVGTPVYVHFYQGKHLRFAFPDEYAAPLVSAGMLPASSPTRFSDSTYSFPYRGKTDTGSGGGRMYLRDPNGTWVRQSVWPFQDTAGEQNSSAVIAGDGTSGRLTNVPLNGQYATLELIPFSSINALGILDGVHYVSGHNNNSENVMQIGGTPVDQTGMTVLQAVDAIIAAGGEAYVILQDVWRTGFNAYVAYEMRGS